MNKILTFVIKEAEAEVPQLDGVVNAVVSELAKIGHVVHEIRLKDDTGESAVPLPAPETSASTTSAAPEAEGGGESV